jgi:hypothetical protein
MRSIEDVKKIAKGKSIPELENIAKLQPKEKAAAEKTLIAGIRNASKKFYVKNLKDHVKSVLEAGIPESSPYVVDYKTMIQKIESL